MNVTFDSLICRRKLATVWLGILYVTLGVNAQSLNAADTVLTFEDLQLPAHSSSPGDATQTPIISHEVIFNRTYNTEFDCCPGAWAGSNRTDLTTPGFGNPYSAYHAPQGGVQGGGVAGSTHYMVASDDPFSPAEIRFPSPTTVQGMFVTNTTYAYLAVKEGRDNDGEPANQFVKGPFEEGDFFKLEIQGHSSGGGETKVDFYLADFRQPSSYVVSEWTWVDLSLLGNQVEKLSFALSSTDNGPSGMNTPAYFAIDNLTLAANRDPSGDFDRNGTIDVADMNGLCGAVGGASNLSLYDLNQDGSVDAGDVSRLLTITGRVPGDTDFNGVVDFPDFLQLSSQYGQRTRNWSDGDFDCNGEVTFADFLLLSNGYGVSAGKGAVLEASSSAALPEPDGGLSVLLFGLFTKARRSRKKNGR